MADTNRFMLSLFDDARDDLSRALRSVSRPKPDYLDAILCLSSALGAITRVISYCNCKMMEEGKTCE